MASAGKWRRRSAAIVGIIAVGWLVVLGPPPILALDDVGRESYRTLKRSEYFSGPAVGIAGIEPEESKAFRQLLATPRGGVAFKYLLFTGSPEARIYALVGLRHTNPLFFSVAVQPFKIWPGEVKTFFGCVMQSESTRVIVRTEGDDPVRLRAGESLEAFWAKKPAEAGADLDVIGGGYTAMFLEWEQLIKPAV